MIELKPCPFCGGAARFFKITDFDDKNFGGEGICCGSCPITTDLMFSLMEDCKPKLAEAWNRRAQPAPITSETGNQAAQGASAITSVPLLTDAEIRAVRKSFFNKPVGFLEISRAIEQAVRSKLGAGVGVGWQLVGYYHKAPSGDPNEDDMFFSDAINGDCPDCHPLYMDASVKVTAKAESYPMTVEQQTDAAKTMSIKANHDPHIISFMMGIEAAERHHGIVGKEGA